MIKQKLSSNLFDQEELMEYSGINYAFVDEKADNSAKIQELG